MGIGISTLSILVGAILVWAVEADVEGVDLGTVGVILLIVGILGLIWSLLVASAIGPFGTRERVIEER